MKRALTTLRVRNFKAIRDTGVIRPGGLTVLIGDNGVGKSCVLEALRLVASLADQPLAEALRGDGRRDDIRRKGGEPSFIEISVGGHVGQRRVSSTVRLEGDGRDELRFTHEDLRTRWFDGWQFLDMAAARSAGTADRRDAGATVRLAPDGSNLAEYLLDLRAVPDRGSDAFAGLVEVLQVVLPYADELVAEIEPTLERAATLQLREGSFAMPSRLLSPGTLRLVALLALLRHPRAPSLLCIEEVENGLDPRAIHVVMEEILRATAGGTQVLMTTHSPYLLDLVPLESLVLVTRDKGDPPRFERPADHEEVRLWARRFTPGRLYAMGTLHRRRDEPAARRPRARAALGGCTEKREAPVRGSGIPLISDRNAR